MAVQVKTAKDVFFTRVNVSLPALLDSASPRFTAVPRRYEETKPVVVQDFTHRKIIDIGSEIHKRSVEKGDIERDYAIKVAEQGVWAAAEVSKATALEQLQKRLACQHERTIKKLKKAQEKELKEEVLRVEGRMTKLMSERVKEEQAAGERRLQEAVRRTEERCHTQLLAAVHKAREEERDMAATEASRVARIAEERLQHSLQEAEQLKLKALSELTERKDKERLEALARARREEQQSAAKRLADLKCLYEQQLNILKTNLQHRKEAIARLKNSLEHMESLKLRAEKEVWDTRKSFQEFIDKTKGFDHGQAEFLIPSLYLEDNCKPSVA